MKETAQIVTNKFQILFVLLVAEGRKPEIYVVFDTTSIHFSRAIWIIQEKQE